MATVQLLGRTLYENQRPYGPGVSPLWSRVRAVPYQESIIIYNNGTVVRGVGFDNDDISDPSVYLFILGGQRFRCLTTDPEYAWLTAAGFTWETIPDYDTYPTDYTDNYP